jgi:hypothetical protein
MTDDEEQNQLRFGIIMDTAIPIPAPKLAPAGAGLPWFELKIAKFGFHLLNRRMTREKSSALLAKECAAILGRVRTGNAETGSRRVLIKRIPGMEDSSRYWSVFMTLDHLRMVNLAAAEAIRLLGQGKVPERKADTAAVKPSAEAGPDVVDDFAFSCQLIEQCAARVPDLKTKARYDHPWFGPLDAAGWHFLAGFHLGLHRKQMEAIMRGLAAIRP